VAAAAGGYAWYSYGGAGVKDAAKDAAAKASGAVASKAFTGGDQGFISLKLDSVENVNHNTKKFRFALPEPDQVSGMPVTSALITKYKGPEMEKPVIRPYTPVNDEGMYLSAAQSHLSNVIQRRRVIWICWSRSILTAPCQSTSTA
jgi:cytochrome-b5 reductase